MQPRGHVRRRQPLAHEIGDQAIADQAAGCERLGDLASERRPGLDRGAQGITRGNVRHRVPLGEPGGLSPFP